MKMLFVLFAILFQSYFSVLPTWNFLTSVNDLLPGTGAQSKTYPIDERYGWYKSNDKLTKTISRDNSGKITHKNNYNIEWDDGGGCIYCGEIEQESMESFYGYVDGETSHSIYCPKSSNNPYELTGNNQNREISSFSSSWITNPKYELKCYYHREEPFLVFYLMNGRNYVLRLKGSTLIKDTKYQFGTDIEEIYDFKLQNREYRDKSKGSYWNNPYPFIALVKKDNYLQIVGAKYDMYANPNQYIFGNNKKLIPIKSHTQAYFNNFHFNNSFFYFTYNTIHDFTCGYSTVSVANENFVDYSGIDYVQFKNNLESPFEFSGEVEIKEMNIMYNNNFVYYKILNKDTQVLYHGILDIYTNKVVWNTDKEVTFFMPYVKVRYTSNQGNYEYADSMLVITKDSAYEVCGIKYNGACVYKCPDNTKMVTDVDGTICQYSESCNGDKRILLPEKICIPQSQCNTTIYKMNNTHCGLCRDTETQKKYRFSFN